MQQDPAFDAVEWHGDPAASGYRYRAWVMSPLGEPAHLVAYADGHWGLDFPKTQYQYVAVGDEGALAAGQRRVFAEWLRRRDLSPEEQVR